VEPSIGDSPVQTLFDTRVPATSKVRCMVIHKLQVQKNIIIFKDLFW
jgi:hypothetical protein